MPGEGQGSKRSRIKNELDEDWMCTPNMENFNSQEPSGSEVMEVPDMSAESAESADRVVTSAGERFSL